MVKVIDTQWVGNTDSRRWFVDIDVARLAKLDQEAAKTAIYYVSQDRVEQGVVALRRRGIELTEDEVFEVAIYYENVWQLREDRETCFLCSGKKPKHVERLCKCFRSVQVGRYLDPTPDAIAHLKDADPQYWHQTPVETFQCKNTTCGKLSTVKAGSVANRIGRGIPWRTPKFCRDCLSDLKSRTPGSDRPARSHSGTSPRPSKKPLRASIQAQADQKKESGDDKLDVKQLQAAVAISIGEA